MATKRGGGTQYLNRKEMQSWLGEEIRDVLKECDLGIRDATEFAVGYLTGALTAEQAHERLNRYQERWGDPLAGVYASSHSGEQSLIDAIDERRKRQKARSFVESVEESNPENPSVLRHRGR